MQQRWFCVSTNETTLLRREWVFSLVGVGVCARARTHARTCVRQSTRPCLSCTHVRQVCPWTRSTLLTSHGPQRFSKVDLLACGEAEREVPWCFEQQHNSGAQVELSQVLALAHGHTLSVVVGHVT